VSRFRSVIGIANPCIWRHQECGGLKNLWAYLKQFDAEGKKRRWRSVE
jgi:hypothetical protein